MTSRAEREERERGTRCCGGESRPTVSAHEAGALSRTFEVLAHPVRLQLLDVLARNEGRVCVCDLEAAVTVKQPTVSHHLKLLREAGIVECERHGVWAYYYVNRDALESLRKDADRFLDALR
jgi:ArsR family transcriptional regulator